MGQATPPERLRPQTEDDLGGPQDGDEGGGLGDGDGQRDEPVGEQGDESGYWEADGRAEGERGGGRHQSVGEEGRGGEGEEDGEGAGHEHEVAGSDHLVPLDETHVDHVRRGGGSGHEETEANTKTVTAALLQFLLVVLGGDDGVDLCQLLGSVTAAGVKRHQTRAKYK